MNFDGCVLKFPGKVYGYSHCADDEDELGIATALSAVEAFRSDWEPLSAEAIVTAIEEDTDDDERPSQPHWLLCRADLPPGVIVNSVMMDPVRTDAASLCRSTIEEWLSGAINACMREKPERRAAWRTLRFGASRACVGPTAWRADRDVLRLRTDAGALTLPLERDDHGTWVSGPRDPAFDQPPIGLTISQRWSLLTLDVIVHYGFWIEAGEPATVRLGVIRDRLKSQGWEAE